MLTISPSVSVRALTIIFPIYRETFVFLRNKNTNEIGGGRNAPALVAVRYTDPAPRQTIPIPVRKRRGQTSQVGRICKKQKGKRSGTVCKWSYSRVTSYPLNDEEQLNCESAGRSDRLGETCNRGKYYIFVHTV